MTLTVDVTKAPRSPMELLTLVAAVQQAHDEDEADWIEWKSARVPPRPYGPLVKTPIWTPTSGRDASDRGWEHPWAEYRFGDAGEIFLRGEDMRPLAAHRSDISLFLTEPADPQVTARWELTATNVDGRLDGELTVRVGKQPIDASRLLAGTLARLPAHLQGPWTLWPGTLQQGA